MDYIFKLIIIGDTGVGKSCILNQYLKKQCKYFWIKIKLTVVLIVFESTKHTVGVEFGMRYMKSNDKKRFAHLAEDE